LELGPDLAYVLAALAYTGQISASQIRKARIGLPSLASAKWTELAPQFGLDTDLMMARFKFDSFSITPVLLPPSFHETIAEAAWHIKDVLQEQVSQEREEVRIRAFDTYLIPIVAFFQGRIIDRPKHPMMSTAYYSGGEVEHELFMIGGVIFIIVEMKLGYEGQDSIAQLLLDLLSAAEMNKNTTFEGLRVHGLLTNLQAFYFYSYDQTRRKFAFDEILLVSLGREKFIADMIRVTNKIFSVILYAYVKGLDASLKESRKRPPASPISSESWLTQQMVCKYADVNTSEQWELALAFATQCLDKFLEPVHTIEDVEKQSCEAIGLLTKSVCVIMRVSHYLGEVDPSTENELKVLARRIVHTVYMTKIEASEQHVRATDGG